uniref:Putative secreted protein n=1 Tax=Amblyomma triste TaxID=251400 RepID=A0A023G1C5_AMBTT
MLACLIHSCTLCKLGTCAQACSPCKTNRHSNCFEIKYRAHLVALEHMLPPPFIVPCSASATSKHMLDSKTHIRKVRERGTLQHRRQQQHSVQQDI